MKKFDEFFQTYLLVWWHVQVDFRIFEHKGAHGFRIILLVENDYENLSPEKGSIFSILAFLRQNHNYGNNAKIKKQKFIVL